jgi:CBS domain-containing protein
MKKTSQRHPFLAHGKLLGIVSERDYTRKVILKGRASKDIPVSEIMTKQVVTVNPSTGITECMRIMTEMHVRHLPVLDGTNLDRDTRYQRPAELFNLGTKEYDRKFGALYPRRN